MTEENRNEKETTDEAVPADETGPMPAVADNGVPVTTAFGEDATSTFPGQVRAALEYAGENKYEYGPRMRDVDLTWDVVSAETMANDIVRVRLEYSPTTSFRGEPGVEYMDIDASGVILARRQIRVPKENKPVVLMGITAFSVVLAVLLISLMTVFKSDAGDPLYVAGRTLWIRAERPKAQEFIVYTGSDTSGVLKTWAIIPADNVNNNLAFVEVTLINQTSGAVSLVIDEDAASLLDGNRVRYQPMDTISAAKISETNARFNVSGFLPMWGSIQLNKNEEVTGMLVFEVPKGSSYSEFRWNASDSAIIRYP
ncbi:MAG: hypothetical protein QF357_02735 [Dehalococcoidia bacterium]|jgi:hypothetical protein|nr:hypothetical protein [Dehalococcoidia bacterium]